MELDLTPELTAFRGEVRQLLETELTADMKAAARRTTTVFADRDLALAWQAILHKRGWAGVAWPEEFGGPGWGVAERHLFNEECVRAGAPGLIPLGLRMLAPVLFRYGTSEQRDYYLPKILSGEHYWCQGYSEPGSGSDLASLSMRAVRDGDEYILNGTKVWTTHAHFADHIFCLVRTDPEARKQAGISFVLVEMHRPGIEIKPIITLAGDHEVNQVFFDQVRIPVSNRVGPENEGWTVAKYLLEFERGAGGAATGLQLGLQDLRLAVEQLPEPDPQLQSETDWIEMEVMALRQMEQSVLARLVQGGNPGAVSSLLKLQASTLGQRISELKMQAVAYYGIPFNTLLAINGEDYVGPETCHTVAGKYLNNRASTIFGGSSEVQKNIIAKVVLGL